MSVPQKRGGTLRIEKGGFYASDEPSLLGKRGYHAYRNVGKKGERCSPKRGKEVILHSQRGEGTEKNMNIVSKTIAKSLRHVPGTPIREKRKNQNSFHSPWGGEKGKTFGGACVGGGVFWWGGGGGGGGGV